MSLQAKCFSCIGLTVALLVAGKYTVFGQVIDGMDVLDKMEKIKVGELHVCHVMEFLFEHYTV